MRQSENNTRMHRLLREVEETCKISQERYEKVVSKDLKEYHKGAIDALTLVAIKIKTKYLDD